MSSLRPKGTRPRGSGRRGRIVPGPGRAVRGTFRSGMTLGELAIVVVLVGIVLSMATPYLLRARSEYTFDNGAREVLRGLQRARFEALRQNASVYFARSSATSFVIEGLGEYDLPGTLRFVSGPDTVRFASFGPVLGGAEPIVLTDGNSQKRILISLSGFASLE